MTWLLLDILRAVCGVVACACGGWLIVEFIGDVIRQRVRISVCAGSAVLLVALLLLGSGLFNVLEVWR